ncbi:MAG: cob(I)yrinic acid a,c-diamide adenosyltransferase [Elusimicrobia bacterium]|nr:cob(I)yrinic acid a,c-diamide adenosyltransferase [Elusimicrobiota bacterium]
MAGPRTRRYAGDPGTTSLLRGPRVRKDHPAVQALGDLDELQSCLGVAVAFLPAARRWELLRSGLRKIQEDLFVLGSVVASLDDPENLPRLSALSAALDRLEVQSRPGPRKGFVLPGGPPPAAFLHLARAVSRRAERSVVALDAPAQAVAYLNRLSRFLFAAAGAAGR